MILSCVQCIRRDYSLGDRLKFQLGIVQNGWFCSVLMLFYVVFWIGNQRGDKGKWEMSMTSLTGVLLVTALSSLFNSDALYQFYSNGAFVAGLIVGIDREKSFKLIHAHWWTIAGLIAIILVLHLSCGLAFRFILPAPKHLARFILHAFWFLGIVALSMKWQFGNRILTWLGTISYELYLVHGWVMDEIRHWWPEWTGPGYVWTVVGTSLLMAWGLHVGVEKWKRCGQAVLRT